MKKWEFDIMDLHALKSCKVEISDHLKWKIQNDPEMKNLVNLAWGIYVRNAPLFLTIPMPEQFGIKEIIIHKEDGKIRIS